MTTDQRLRPRKQPKQDRSVETRSRILDAAARVFAEHGYSAGTTNRIADEAGLSVGSLYQYFPNKDSILVELSRAHVAAGTARLHELLGADLPDGLEARLRLAVRATISAHDDDHRLHQVLFEEAPRPAPFLDELRTVEEALVALVAAMLDDDPEVDVPDTTLAARMVVTTVESLVHRFIAREPGTLDVEAFEEDLVRMLSRYLRG